jgi:hypothetical protein
MGYSLRCLILAIRVRPFWAAFLLGPLLIPILGSGFSTSVAIRTGFNAACLLAPLVLPPRFIPRLPVVEKIVMVGIFGPIMIVVPLSMVYSIPVAIHFILGGLVAFFMSFYFMGIGYQILGGSRFFRPGADTRADVSISDLSSSWSGSDELEDRFYELAAVLLEYNPYCPDTPDDPEMFAALALGQRCLHCVTTFDCQVKNGGINQFFWNHPGFIFPMLQAAQTFDPDHTAVSYEKALAELVGGQDKWLELRGTWPEGDEPDVEAYLKSVELLDLEWFDDEYLGDWDDGPEGGKIKVALSLEDHLLTGAVEYVRDHPEEFIRG